ncbi:hypothetical protein M404DRAFT_780014 [Pisolithus tinctorius Marx 270]|uniref:Uncharacterized protein n=1 Tax=Pisolithus tinctorius Marx 270 TaxID=870435 RepID=A0A0C3NWC1_PISTI|nr:hypothetical protein M404DRAFT_780014 [Pisolithus tinctorius Marx 270]
MIEYIVRKDRTGHIRDCKGSYVRVVNDEGKRKKLAGDFGASNYMFRRVMRKKPQLEASKEIKSHRNRWGQF